MKRRSFFQILSALTAALFLPPIRAAKAVQSRVRRAFPRSWLDGKRYWEPLEEPIPAPNYSPYVAHPLFADVVPPEDNDAQIVCRVLRGNHHSRTNVGNDAEFTAAMEEAGWMPKEIHRQMNPGLVLRCQGCNRAHWVASVDALAHDAWQVEPRDTGWVAYCPDHREVTLDAGTRAPTGSDHPEWQAAYEHSLVRYGLKKGAA